MSEEQTEQSLALVLSKAGCTSITAASLLLNGYKTLDSLKAAVNNPIAYPMLLILQPIPFLPADITSLIEYFKNTSNETAPAAPQQQGMYTSTNEAKIDRALFLLEKMSKSSKASYSMSKISGVKWTEISDSARLKLRDSKITVKVKKGATAVNYQWLKGVGETQHIEFDEEAAVDNDEEEEQLSVMEWLERHIPIDQKHFAYHNVSNDGSFLLVSSYADCLPFSLKGTTAIIIAPPQRHRALLKSQIYVCIELKKPENLVDNSFYQGWAQLIAASIHTTSHPVIHLLTDLNEAWYFSWWSHPLELSHASLNNAQARSFIQEYLGEFKSGWLGGDYSNNTGFKHGLRERDIRRWIISLVVAQYNNSKIHQLIIVGSTKGNLRNIMDTDRVLKDQQHIDRLDDLQAVHGDFRKEHRNLIFEKDFLKFDPKMPDVDVFITNIKTYIQTSQYPTSPFYIYLLARRIFPAEYHKGLNLNNREGMTLKELCTAIRHKCTSKPLIEYKKDFENLVQGNMSVVEYMTAFNNLEIYCCELNTAGLQRKFLEGLRKDKCLGTHQNTYKPPNAKHSETDLPSSPPYFFFNFSFVKRATQLTDMCEYYCDGKKLANKNNRSDEEKEYYKFYLVYQCIICLWPLTIMNKCYCILQPDEHIVWIYWSFAPRIVFDLYSPEEIKGKNINKY
ncbi:hypothetical protein PPL_04825 [Heterostelium album PN500]|uniref:Retrotransposon gag domain-containing protein n=1 Tax=Heterostelium pallidum (strain ATCC 26659 / Pp 5 / PN500) TaxID=670386 RepID=D3B8N2_HETP5|nr:hypothetical protein PPL_04825 [Heterostelium album PN500]EFA82400.1 hypothetical protein PPL_04825 [Heterostelium album PN500]|eukprot:XP_020434517.1 hypothetical protein PPL_04825 [Heterostelium album PN500]